MKFLMITIWFLMSLSLWLFATAIKIENPQFKHYEFRAKSVFYWIAVLTSLLIGISI
jgi:uncharacterized membrane protein